MRHAPVPQVYTYHWPMSTHKYYCVIQQLKTTVCNRLQTEQQNELESWNVMDSQRTVHSVSHVKYLHCRLLRGEIKMHVMG